MGILSPSEIFTKHGDKMIFKNPILSPSKIYDNGDLVSIRNTKTKTFKFLLFCYSNCEDRLLDISFYTFFISKLGYIFALSFCFQLLDTSQASSAMLQSEMMVDCILFDQ